MENSLNGCEKNLQEKNLCLLKYYLKTNVDFFGISSPYNVTYARTNIVTGGCVELQFGMDIALLTSVCGKYR
jgi:hypothetical protein